MTCMEFETLQKIIAEVLDVEEDEITMDTRLLEDLIHWTRLRLLWESRMNWELQFLRKSSKAKIWQPLAMCTN